MSSKSPVSRARAGVTWVLGFKVGRKSGESRAKVGRGGMTMNFMDTVNRRKQQSQDAEVFTAGALTDADIPAGMPLTRRLDEMTTEQARWAIQNGDAWIAYLSAKGAAVVGDSHLYQTDVNRHQTQGESLCIS